MKVDNPAAPEHLTKRRAQLDMYAKHDFYIALVMALSTFTFAPFAILLLPFLYFLNLLFTRPNLSKNRNITFRKLYSFPRLIFLKKSNDGNSKTFSIPFASIVQLPQHVIEAPESNATKSTIHHELSHHYHCDSSVFIWFVASSFIFFTGSLLQIPNIFFGTIDIFNNIGVETQSPRADIFRILFLIISCIIPITLLSRKFFLQYFSRISFTKVLLGLILVWVSAFAQWMFSIYVLNPTVMIQEQSGLTTNNLYRQAWFWYLSFLFMSLTALLLSVRLLHRMEYVADNDAAHMDYTGYVLHRQRFLNPKIGRRATNKLVAFFNRLTHPSQQARLNALIEDPKSDYYLYLYILFWSLSVGISISIASINEISVFGDYSVLIAKLFALLSIAIVLIHISNFFYKTFVFRNKFFSLETFYLAISYLLGFSVPLVFIRFFVFSNNSSSIEIWPTIFSVLLSNLLIILSLLTISSLAFLGKKFLISKLRSKENIA